MPFDIDQDVLRQPQVSVTLQGHVDHQKPKTIQGCIGGHRLSLVTLNAPSTKPPNATRFGLPVVAQLRRRHNLRFQNQIPAGIALSNLMNRFVFALSLAFPAFASAHPGHGNETLQDTPFHLLEPEHALALIPLLVAGGFLAWKAIQRDREISRSGGLRCNDTPTNGLR